MVDDSRSPVGGSPTDVIRPDVAFDFRRQTRPPCWSRGFGGAIYLPEIERSGDKTQQKVTGAVEEAESLHHRSLSRKGKTPSTLLINSSAYCQPDYPTAQMFPVLLFFRGFSFYCRFFRLIFVNIKCKMRKCEFCYPK